MNESELIQQYFARSCDDDPLIAVGIGDDAAVLKIPEGQQLVVTTDTMVVGTHFYLETDPYDIGYKLVAVNLSDIAAMGALPKWATLNLTLTTVDPSWLEKFSKGLFECAQKFNVHLVGGDVTKGKQLNVSMQLIGTAPNGEVLSRVGAQPEDIIFVTGKLGLPAYSLQVLQTSNNDHNQLSEEQRDALYRPIPRVAIGQRLLGLATSAIDISDGLLHEVEIISQPDSLGAQLDINLLPKENFVPTEMALTGGEDYELLFTVNPAKRKELDQSLVGTNCPVTAIGTVTESGTIELQENGQSIPLPKTLGFDHFAK